MSDHESPISIQAGGTLAKAIVSQGEHWSVPDGAILASWMLRVAAFLVDVVIVNSVLMLISRQEIMNAWNLSLWNSADFHYALAFSVTILASHWLYWRLTGLAYSRSLGQKMFGIAIVCDDGSGVTSKMWDRRAAGKLLYLLPLVNLYFAVYEIARISQRHTHQSNLDLKVGTIVAQAESLPPASRRHIR
ncbi:MAG: RDD family protein [Candidatus Thermoplasmatota archaeon]|nr:RDD family protein [Candidatus Thermoplasmatota archaeon]